MRADNSHHLTANAQQRSQAAQRRAVAALRRMDNTGIAVTFDSVAREAGVSRSWLYTHPDLRAEIERLRRRAGPTTPTRRIPDRQRTSDASLLHRLETANERIRQLHDDNLRLRAALAEALGTNRIATTRQPRRDTPTPARISKVTRPCS